MHGSSISFVQESTIEKLELDGLEQIILIRYGEPSLNRGGRYDREEVADYYQQYDRAGVGPLSFMPLTIEEGETLKVFTSPLPRARHTAELLFGSSIDIEEDGIFREFERKVAGLPGLRMPLRAWTTFSRMLWLIGSNDSGIETYKEAKGRAKAASQKLAHAAKKHKKVVLVAHGFLNRQLVIELKSAGWLVVRRAGKGYLGATLLVRTGG